jgi:KDO2-lipid IV(A) lauroyltransferase
MASASKKLASVSKDIGYISAYTLLRALPIKCSGWLGAVLGERVGRSKTAINKRLIKSIAHLNVLPEDSEEQRARYIQSIWQYQGQCRTDFAIFTRILRSGNRIQFEEQEKFFDLVDKKQPRPVIFLCLHTGNWELLGSYLHLLLNEHRGQSRKKLLQIFQTLDSKMEMFLAKFTRRKFKDCLITNSPTVGRKLIQHLKSDGYLNIFVDEYLGKQVYFPPFGREFPPKGNINNAIRLAKMTDAILCPLYLCNTGEAHYQIKMLEPYQEHIAELTKPQLADLKMRIADDCESVIKQYFDQWLYNIQLRFD